MKPEKMRKAKLPPLRLKTKINFLFVLFAVIVGILLYVCSNLVLLAVSAKGYWDTALSTAYIVADALRTADIEQSILNMEQNEAYEEAFQKVKMYQKVLYMHDVVVFVPGSNSYQIYMAAQDEEEGEALGFGMTFPYQELHYEYLLPLVEKGVALDYPVFKAENQYHEISGLGGIEVCAWAPVKDSRGRVIAMVEADLTFAQALRDAQPFISAMMILYAVVTVLYGAIQITVVRRMILRPLQKVTARAKNFAAGETLGAFDNDIQTGDELQTLNEALEKMAEDIVRYTERQADIMADEERIAAELKVASEIQRSLRPEQPEPFLQKYGFWLGEHLVGAAEYDGDFYDYIPLDDARLAIVLCSIDSNGLGAAVKLLSARTIIRGQLLGGVSLEQAMCRINRQLYQMLQNSGPIRVFVGVLDGEHSTLTYINANSSAPILMCRGQAYTMLPGPGYAPVGQVENISYQEQRVFLQQGDRLLWYSDGVLDALDEEGRPLGVDGLKQVLSRRRVKDARQLLEELSAPGGVLKDLFGGCTLILLECRSTNRERAQLRVAPEEEHREEVLFFVKEQLELRGVLNRERAQMLVCAEELFSIFCRYTQRGMIEVSCAPEKDRAVLRFIADLNGLDPFEHDAGELMENAVQYIRKYSGSASSRILYGHTIVEITAKDASAQTQAE
ncbi:MAG: SpoIIE family protein phosphatase [Faecalibacterium sp.]